MSHIVAQHHEAVLGLRVHNDDVAAQLGGAARHGGAGMARAAHHDVAGERLGDIRDLGLVAQPTGAEHLAHGLALVAAELHACACGGCGGLAFGGGSLLGQGGAGGHAGGGSDARTGDEVAAGQGCGQRDGAAHVPEGFDELSLVQHAKPLFSRSVGAIRDRRRRASLGIGRRCAHCPVRLAAASAALPLGRHTLCGASRRLRDDFRS